MSDFELSGDLVNQLDEITGDLKEDFINLGSLVDQSDGLLSSAVATSTTGARVTQEVVEIAEGLPNNLLMTQIVNEIANKPPNNLLLTSICVEIAVRVRRNYTDSAASTNFTH